MTSRDSTRRYLIEAWRKARAGLALDPLEILVADVIRSHPEFHALLADPAVALSVASARAGGDANPFLHLGLHIALAEQLQADRPAGVRATYARLQRDPGLDRHTIEHRMLACLAETLAVAQRRGSPPVEQEYLDALGNL